MSPRLRHLGAALVRLGFALGRMTLLRSRVVLATAHADRIGGNLAFIRDELASRQPRIPTTVLAHRASDSLSGRARSLFDLVVAGWHLATARVVVVDDYYFPMDAIRPRPGTTRVQVWHACGAFKRFGYSVLDKGFGADEAAVAGFPIHVNYDLCLVSAMRIAPFYAEAFRQPVERFASRFGIPRTDLFFDAPRVAAAAAAVRARYRIPPDRRVILYAPTFRGERTTQARSPEDLDLDVLRDALGSDHVLLVRAHPFAAARSGAASRGRAGDAFAIDVSDHPEIDELMLVSDVLVTDYSSAIYEFALLDRPIGFFAPDHAAYARERGFYLDYPADLPGPAFETTEDLAGWLRAGAFDLERIRRFRNESFDVADGRATRRLVDEIVVPALTGLAPR
jgi:CDP-glycerol glycerophosphotransferase (TagB/SpsB family)